MQIRSNPLGSVWNVYISIFRNNKIHICVCLFLIVVGCSGNDPNTLYQQGLKFKENGEFVQARLSFIKAIELEREFPEAYHGIGSIYFNLGKYDSAIVFYSKALLYDSTFAPAYFDIAASCFNLGDTLKSIEYYRKSLNYQDSTDRALTYSALGSAFIQLEKNDLARVYYLKALKYDSNSTIIFQGLGAALCGLNKWKDAKAAFQNALRLDQNNERAKYGLDISNLNINLISEDPAYLKLSQQEHNYLKYVFENASYNFQFLIQQNVMPYDEFLRLSLDQQIKKCNQLKKGFNMDNFTFSYALQEWLRINAKTASTIVFY